MKNKLLISMMCAASFSFTMPASAADSDPAKVLKNTKEKAEADYKLARAKCDSLKDNPKDVCIAEAKAARVHTEENAQAAFHNTLSARTSAIKNIADADYEVEKEKCKASVGNEKDVCIQKAKAAKVASVSAAKADKKVIEARTDEADDKRNAEYKVAIEKCDALAGAAKDTCVAGAKKKYGK